MRFNHHNLISNYVFLSEAEVLYHPKSFFLYGVWRNCILLCITKQVYLQGIIYVLTTLSNAAFSKDDVYSSVTGK